MIRHKKYDPRIVLTVLSATLVGALLYGCIGQTTDTRNPFVTATEQFGNVSSGGDGTTGGAGGVAAEGQFRQMITITLANNHPLAELNTSFIAWVSPNSITSVEDENSLLVSGYVELDTQVQIGSSLLLIPGTFVYNGPGIGGATAVQLDPTRVEIAEDGTFVLDPALAVLAEFNIVTPDGILVFSQPPVSCENVAFFYTIDGDPLTSVRISGVGNVFGGPESGGGLKTLAQVDAYQCDPFKPGLFLRIGGGAVADNEYFEGEDIRFDFYPFAVDGWFAHVTRGGA